MNAYKYVIVGGGMTGHAAARGIRDVDPSGEIAIIGDEAHPPYARPPLSKGLWQGKPEDSVWLGDTPAGVTFNVARATSVDRTAREVRDQRGDRYRYQKLLLATGGSPREIGVRHERVIYYRTLDDYRRTRSLAPGAAVVVIGGSFIGSEIAAALAPVASKVTMLFPEPGICARAFPADLSRYVTEFYRSKGVEVMPQEMVRAVYADGSRVRISTESGRTVDADFVVVGIGIRPNVELAETAGLQVQNGIEVDARLQTSDPNIYAAGDVARFHSPHLGKPIRVEHEDAANTMGFEAGRSMAGAPVNFTHLPFFYSDLFELGYEAVGEIDSRHQAFADWKTENREGVIYFLEGGRVRGVLLWNVWGQVPAARELIAEPGPFTADQLRGRIPM
ncbi:MAG TPA: FAD-dependent oxidoreductase [Myxococcaceae bacterium]|nr:FAD-dependent oxidoreductase [Myxococcaceae bacterium]